MRTAIVTPGPDTPHRPRRGAREPAARLIWRGLDSLPACIGLIRAGRTLELELPSHLRDSLPGHLSADQDGPALLGALSGVRGLELLGLLVLPAQITEARARLLPGPVPRLVILPLRRKPAGD